MRKLILCTTIGLLMGVLLATSAFAVANPKIKLVIDGQEVQPGTPPQMINGKVMVPIRFVTEYLGGAVNWDAKDNAVIITSPTNHIPSTPKKSIEKEPTIRSKRPGETATSNGISVTIKDIKYTDTGFNVYFKIKNNSDYTLKNPGKLTFTLKDQIYEDEVNTKGYIYKFDRTGNIYPGETRDGYYQYLFEKDVEITSITYHLMKNGYPGDSLAKWDF